MLAGEAVARLPRERWRRGAGRPADVVAPRVQPASAGIVPQPEKRADGHIRLAGYQRSSLAPHIALIRRARQAIVSSHCSSTVHAAKGRFSHRPAPAAARRCSSPES